MKFPRFPRALGGALLAVACGTGILRAAEPAAPTATAAVPAPTAVVPSPALFDYAPLTPADVVLRESTRRGNATVDDVTLPAVSPDAAPVKALLVRPAGKGPFAAVLWVHWLGERATTNRTQFLDEAVALADAGTVSLLVEAMWAEPRWYRNRKFETDRTDSARQVIELRRGLDVLLAQPGVEPARVAFVGHDYGAMHGAILAGIDARVHDWVFIAGTPSLLDWAFFVGKPASMETYVADMRAVDVTEHLRRAQDGRFLLQYAETDQYVPLAKALEFFAATPGAKEIEIHGGASHAMTEVPAIRANRDAWLRKALRLPPATAQ